MKLFNQNRNTKPKRCNDKNNSNSNHNNDDNNNIIL